VCHQQLNLTFNGQLVRSQLVLTPSHRSSFYRLHKCPLLRRPLINPFTFPSLRFPHTTQPHPSHHIASYTQPNSPFAHTFFYSHWPSTPTGGQTSFPSSSSKYPALSTRDRLRHREQFKRGQTRPPRRPVLEVGSLSFLPPLPQKLILSLTRPNITP
jgi:hypothetical protein